MRTVLSAVNNDSLLNRIRASINNRNTTLYYASDVSKVASIAQEQEIACLIADFTEKFSFGEEICETISSINSDTKIIAIFNDQDTSEIVKIYNTYPVYCLLNMQNLNIDDLLSLIEKCFHAYNRIDDLDVLDSDYKDLNEKYMIPMQEMSSILNDSFSGFDSVVSVFKKSIDFIVGSSDKSIKYINIFVDRIINDFIQIYMIKEPDFNVYCSKIQDLLNNPDKKRYFKFIYDDIDPKEIDGDVRCNLLFILDVITMGIDVFYPYYRGKITVSKNERRIDVNALYEVRTDKELLDIYKFILSIMDKTIMTYSNGCRFAVKDSLVQFKAALACN